MTLKKLKKILERYTIPQLKNFIKSYSGGHLPNGKSHEGSLFSDGGTPYLKSVFGSALSVVNEGKEPSDEVLNKAQDIINTIVGGNPSYNLDDAKVCYGYLILYRKLKKEGFWVEKTN